MSRFYPLEKLMNLHPGYVREFRIDDHHLLLIQRGEDRHLIEARCPHREHPLDQASIEAGTIVCALHHYRFNIASGALLSATEEPCRHLRVYELVYEGNEIGLILGRDSL